jgi:hypothetical protein
VTAAVADLDGAFERWEGLDEPQLMIPGLALGAATWLELGDRARAEALLARLLDLKRRLASLRFAAPALVVDAAIRLGRGSEFLEPHLDAAHTRWLLAAKAFLARDFDAAIAIYEAMPSPLDSSIVRVAYAEALVEVGDRDGAVTVLGPALAFFRNAGAARVLERVLRIV